MLRFTQHCKDTIQERLAILVTFFTNLLEYRCAKNYQIKLGLKKLLQK